MKMIPKLRNKPYEERLKEFDLFSLSKSKVGVDLIEIFIILCGFNDISINDYVITNLTKAPFVRMASRSLPSYLDQ